MPLPIPSQCPAAAGGDVCHKSMAPPQKKNLAPTGTRRSTEDAPMCGLITSSHTAAQGSAQPRVQALPRPQVQVEWGSNIA